MTAAGKGEHPLRARQVTAGLTQGELERVSGVPRETISRVETGSNAPGGRGPPRTTVAALGFALGVDWRQLEREIAEWEGR